MTTSQDCTCGVNSDLIRGSHEPTCGIPDCGMCGVIGQHSAANCPEFRNHPSINARKVTT